MQINLKTWTKISEVVRKLTSKTSNGTKENVIARIALGYSLQTGKDFHLMTEMFMILKGKT
jgi:DNA sulfur modification protein DndE